jgi:hypothetical protein
VSNENIIFAGIKSKDIYRFGEVDRDYAILLEYDTQVAFYSPAQMGLRIERNPEKYINLNFWVMNENKVERLVYIHNGDLTLDHRKEAVTCLKNTKEVFTPVTEQTVQREPRCSNLRLLWKYADEEIQITYLPLLNKFFAITELPNLGKLQKFLEEQGIDKNIIYTFIFKKLVVCNIRDFKLSEISVVMMNPIFEICENWKRDFEENIEFF